jgi:hypothetical protein
MAGRQKKRDRYREARQLKTGELFRPAPVDGEEPAEPWVDGKEEVPPAWQDYQSTDDEDDKT